MAHDAVTPPAEVYCGPVGEPRPDVDGGSGSGADSSPSKPDCVPQPQPDPIQRSLVIGGDLWTLGQWVLQQSTLADLSIGTKVPVA